MASDLPDGTDPALLILADNGGNTLTHALPESSPATNAVPLGGSCPPPTVDQRGEPRPIADGCDIGAFELFIADIFGNGFEGGG